MTTFFATIGLLSLILSAGAIEADNYLLGFMMALFGIITSVCAIYFQNKENSKDTQLYYRDN